MKKWYPFLSQSDFCGTKETRLPLTSDFDKAHTLYYIHDTWQLTSLRIYLLMSCHSKMRISIIKPSYSSNWDAVVRLTPIIYIECTLNFWAISSKCICGIRPFFKCLYRLRPNNNYIIMKHLRTFWFIVFLWQEWVVRYDFCFVCQICPWHANAPKQAW